MNVLSPIHRGVRKSEHRTDIKGKPYFYAQFANVFTDVDQTAVRSLLAFPKTNKSGTKYWMVILTICQSRVSKDGKRLVAPARKRSEIPAYRVNVNTGSVTIYNNRTNTPVYGSLGLGLDVEEFKDFLISECRWANSVLFECPF